MQYQDTPHTYNVMLQPVTERVLTRVMGQGQGSATPVPTATGRMMKRSVKVRMDDSFPLGR